MWNQLTCPLGCPLALQPSGTPGGVQDSSMSSLQSNRTADACRWPPAHSLLLFTQCGVSGPDMGTLFPAHQGKKRGSFAVSIFVRVIYTELLVFVEDHQICPVKECGEQWSHCHQGTLTKGKVICLCCKSPAQQGTLGGTCPPSSFLQSEIRKKCDKRTTLTQKIKPGIWSCSMIIFPFPISFSLTSFLHFLHSLGIRVSLYRSRTDFLNS